jgi:NitT/TauT family transport system substrate-binding protein
MLNRRSFIAALPIALAAPRLARAAAGPLTLWGPPAAPSIVLAQAIANGALKEVDAAAAFRSWRTPDEMRAGLSSGAMQAVIVPSNVAANLYNRGLAIQLLNIMTRGLLYIVGSDKYTRITDFAGKTIAVPFRNDMPDLLMRRLVAKAGMKAGQDVRFEYSGTPPEAMQMLLAGRVEAALLSEPGATAAILRGKLSMSGLVRAIDFQKEWARIIGGSGFIPQAGLVVARPFADRLGPAGLAAFQKALESAVDYVVEHPYRASVVSATELGLLSPVVAEAIPYSNLAALAASSIRPDLERFFSMLAEDDPRIIGGKLPDDAFYAL